MKRFAILIAAMLMATAMSSTAFAQVSQECYDDPSVLDPDDCTGVGGVKIEPPPDSDDGGDIGGGTDTGDSRQEPASRGGSRPEVVAQATNTGPELAQTGFTLSTGVVLFLILTGLGVTALVLARRQSAEG